MQTPNEHISLLTELLPRYRSVNILYRETVDKFVLSFDAQCTITDFYKEFNDVQAFEKAVMNILLSTDKEKSVLITSNLRTEIHKNIDIYIYQTKISLIELTLSMFVQKDIIHLTSK